MDKDLIIQEVVTVIRRYLDETYQVFIFGSWARGNARETSDIDIGILGQEKVSRIIMYKILGEVENIKTLRTIDVVDFNTKNKNFKENVLAYAKVL